MIPPRLLQSVGNVFIMQSADADKNKKSHKKAMVKNHLTVAAKRERSGGAQIILQTRLHICWPFQMQLLRF